MPLTSTTFSMQHLAAVTVQVAAVLLVKVNFARCRPLPSPRTVTPARAIAIAAALATDSAWPGAQRTRSPLSAVATPTA
jgi:hypothetical protein